MQGHRPSSSTGMIPALRQLLRDPVGVLQEYSVPLIVGVVAGLLVANIDSEAYRDLVHFHLFGKGATVFGRDLDLHFLINEIFMVFFFGIAAKEITDSVLPGGVLNPIGKAINPLLGTLGGVFGPVGVYFLLTFIIYGGTENFGDVSKGWAIPTATDIALAWLVARLVFGPHHPAVNFLLLLAVADDAIGLGIIAAFYPDPDHPAAPVWLLLTAGGMGVAFAMRRLGVRYWLLYVMIAGAMSWVGMVKAAIEPALALVVIVPFLPSAGPNREPEEVQGEIQTGGNHPLGHSPLETFEHQLKLPVDLGLFFFAFANAGVSFGNINSITWMVLGSLVVGKTVGVTLFSLAASRAGFPLPAGMGPRHVVVAGMVAGLGLTVALFVAEKAFEKPEFLDPAKMGAVFSAAVAIVAFAAGKILRVKAVLAAGSAEE